MEAVTTTVNNRVLSIDLLRGLTIAAMIMVNNPGTWSHIYAPLGHAPWHGYTPTDLIFPFFLFIVGCSISFAYRGKEAGPDAYRKIVVRSLKLIGLGIFLGAFLIYPPFVKAWSEIRLPGVLQRIGLVFLLAAPLALHLRSRHLLWVTVGLLLGYWLWMGFLPLPDGSDPTYERAPNNWAMYVDKLILGTHTWQEDYDPEGLLSTLPAVATCLIGVVTGRYLLGPYTNKTRGMLMAGGVLLVLGHAWGLVFPINKALWTSSFVLVTAGWALVVLAAIYYITDVKGIVWGRIFSYAGANALILYFLSSFFAKIFGSIRVGETSLHGYLYETVFVHDFLLDRLSSLLYALVLVAFYLALGAWLYHRRIFVKV
ncbi:putative acyltransferase [Lewinella marina]|uniref:Heparan-alpha-glucosaminide N-acetyltransferase n=1 Tax=Neolewinella marina TaxID=438751 RepID=A0A2G0CF65_9BACT|nr:heparan-alpha-glucosaminide N-acetyltransferase domain-containing protein [Neolewinella marina]NJB85706.1 putative acyltransferase [Neolewinella marina]PHK98616.1 heparan-alpha-glucosaminide N-acetyltransferase [Neolewinella marina]